MAYLGTMKYFKLVHEGKNPFPRIVNWNQSLDVRKLNRRDYQELPSFFLLDMELGLDAFLPDVLVSPFLLVSKSVMEVVVLYDQNIPFRFTALFDTKKGECSGYYCPILKEEECVVTEDIYRGEETWLNRKKMSGLPLFCIRREKSEILLRMDLAESLLGRGVTGVQLREVYLEK